MKSINSIIKEFYRRMKNTEEKRVIKKIFKNRVLVYMVKYSSLPVYEVKTITKHYIVKTYPKDTDIFDVKKYLKEQVKYVEELYNKGVNVAMPIKINNNYVYETKTHYYIVYEFIKNYAYVKKFERLGRYNSKIDFEKLVDLLIGTQSVDKKLELDMFYKEIPASEMDDITDMIEKNNYYVKKVKNELTLCHNDFRPHNVLWSDSTKNFYLIDFDTVAYAYKYANLIEVAINFSYNNTFIDYEIMEKIFKCYFKKVKDKGDFEMAFYLALNGKLVWLKHMLDHKDPNVHYMIDLFKYIKGCKEKIKEIYLNA